MLHPTDRKSSTYCTIDKCLQIPNCSQSSGEKPKRQDVFFSLKYAMNWEFDGKTEGKKKMILIDDMRIIIQKINCIYQVFK